jgi:hypothetical protein
MKMIRSLFFAITIVALLAGASDSRAIEVSAHIEFGSVEISIIQKYFHEHEYKDSHRKKGKKSLPPGIAKNLGRGKPLPPGIAKQVLPTGLLHQLPPVPHGFERVIVDGKVLLVEIATQVIHDVLEGLILG